MKTIKIKRFFLNDYCTLGVLTIEGYEFPLFTLEQEDNHNERNNSCIPSGEYIVKPYSSAKYKNSYEVQDVPNRDKILFHSGVVAKHSRGCIMVATCAFGIFKYRDLAKQIAIVNNYKETTAIDVMRKMIGQNDFKLIIT